MNIQYYGDYCFKLTTKPGGRATEDIVVWTDLPDKQTGIRSPFGHADIVLLSHYGPSDEALAGLKDEPVIIYTPGEYAAKGVSVLGFPTRRDADGGITRGQNTIYVFDSEDVRIAYLGSLGHELDSATVGKIGEVDILFVPIGGVDTITIKIADELIRAIGPKIVIPMHYRTEGVSIDAATIDDFCKETGRTVGEEVARLNFKNKDLYGKSMEVVCLQKT